MGCFGRSASISMGVAAALLSVGAQADLDMQPGLWETTITVQMPGMSFSPPPTKQRHCINKDDLVPQDPQSAKNCQRLEHHIEGNTVIWSAECQHQGRVTVGSGRITYAGDTYTGSMEMEMRNGPNGSMKMTQSMQGRRIGDCTK